MKYEIIDFHMHPYLENPDFDGRYPQYLNVGVNAIMREMEKAGISRYCGSNIKKGYDNAATFEGIRLSNREVIKVRELTGGKCIPGIHVSPLFIKESLEEIEYAVENGVNLIGEIVPRHYGWEDYSCKEFSEILDAVAPHHMVVSLHTDTDVMPGMEKMALAHKDINFVFAHPGEHDRLLKHIDIMKKCDNVYLDLSGTGIFRYGMLRFLIRNVGAERILFGTDYPGCNPYCYVSGVLGEELPEEQNRLIFAENAKRLLSLK